MEHRDIFIEIAIDVIDTIKRFIEQKDDRYYFICNDRNLTYNYMYIAGQHVDIIKEFVQAARQYGIDNIPTFSAWGSGQSAFQRRSYAFHYVAGQDELFLGYNGYNQRKLEHIQAFLQFMYNEKLSKDEK